MIRMIQSTSADHAKNYFNEALLKSDYYLDDQELLGFFHGKIADRLGLKGPASKEVFHSLCENINPTTGDNLTPRTIDQRTVGYDINFHCPKSVSLVHALSKDDHIIEAFQSAVSDTMLDIESDSKTRIRKAGQYDDRETGELIWAEFTHQTARPVEDALPDPHLHSHNFVFNTTWDKTEQQFKAGQFRDIKRDMPYYQARFHKRLADNLISKGYQIKRTDKSFEIEGVPQKAIDLFSKRTDEIGRVAKEKGITDAKELDALGARTRSKKQKGFTMSELKKHWRNQIKALGLDRDGATIRHAFTKQPSGLQPKHCIDHALQHRFERASVMQDRRILETAYRHALGKTDVSIDSITEAFEHDSRIIHVPEKWRTVCTTKEALAEEQHMVNLANQGKGKLRPLYIKEPKIDLKGEQYEAVRHVLMTPHRVTIIRGRAGTGKTTLMKEAVSHINKAGKKTFIVAPTAQASRGVLKDEGFNDATTVADLLKNKEAQDRLDGQVLWVDEAGLLGTKDMTSLLDLATRRNARLVLSGDTRQHSSVVRGDALRILNIVANIRSAEVSRIYRQKNEDYREAVQHLSEGKVKNAFDKLDGMNAIKTIDPLKPNEKLVDDYLSAVKKGKSALVISPTHKQGEETTEAIRQKLRAAKLIGKKETKIKRLVNLNFTEAEKADIRNYKIGDVIQMNQNVRGIKRGSTWSILSAKDNTLEIIDRDKRVKNLTLDQSEKFDVFKKDEIGISKGDKIRVTRNGFDANDKRLNNGQAFEVLSVSKAGNIKVRNTGSKSTYRLPRDYGHISHAHCITSYSAQGKTYDEVFIVQPAATFPATDMKQFYVSVSRGRDAAHIYTDDKASLLEYASQVGDRQSAIELVGKDRTNDAVNILSRERMNQNRGHEREKIQVQKPEQLKQRSYEREPEI